MQDATLKIPGEIAVMILPETVLFPGGLLPLYIFEPRYRTMLAEALESHRMFAIALQQPDSPHEKALSVGCAGFVRACVANADGTSHLMLQGAGRVQFTEWLPGKTFPQAKIKLLRSRAPESRADRIADLREEIRDLCEKLGQEDAEVRRQIETFFEKTDDTAEFADLVSFSIVRDFQLRQHLLEELKVESRLAIIAAYISRLIPPEKG